MTPPAATPVFDADHWAANLRNPVRFSQAIATAGADHATFIEISPHPLLTHAINDTLAAPPSPDRRHPAARRRRHPDVPHQPQRHPHHPRPTHTAPARTTPTHPHHPLAPHPPLDRRPRAPSTSGDPRRSAIRGAWRLHCFGASAFGCACAATGGAGAPRVAGRSRHHGAAMAQRPPGPRCAGLSRGRLL